MTLIVENNCLKTEIISLSFMLLPNNQIAVEKFYF